MSDEDLSIIIPSSPADRLALKQGIEQLVNSKVRADSERDYQTETCKELAEKFDIPVKHIKHMATDAHKVKFDTDSAERDEYEALYETIMTITGDGKVEEEEESDDE